MVKLEDFCRKAIELGATKAKIIKAEDVIVADWVRLKCQSGFGGCGAVFGFHYFNVRNLMMWIVTPIAMSIRIILIKGISIMKRVEYPIVTHKKEMDNTFILRGIPFFSR